MPPQAALLFAPPKAPPGAGFPATAAGPRPTSSWLLMPAFRCIAGGVLLRTMHVLALFYHPMASNHPGIICVMQRYNSPAALSFA